MNTEPPLERVALTVYQGPAGDRNPRATMGSINLGRALSKRIGLDALAIGRTSPPLGGRWEEELAAALPGLRELQSRVRELIVSGTVPLSVIGRCAAAVATLPVIAQHRPDVLVVWFDAHADCNTPKSVSNPYLGGMPISAAAGLWDSGLGAGLDLRNVILVGSRDIDPDEYALINAGAPRLVPVSADLPQCLQEAVAGHSMYVHLDCDVLEPGIVPTEYLSPGGLTLDALRGAMAALGCGEIVGLEIAEFEATWPNDPTPVSPDGLLRALAPLLDRWSRACATTVLA